MKQRNCEYCLKVLGEKYPNRKYCDNGNKCKQAAHRLVLELVAHIKECNLCRVRTGHHVSALRRKTHQTEILTDMETAVEENWAKLGEEL